MVEGYSQGCKLRSCLACVSMVRVDSSGQKKLLGEETQAGSWQSRSRSHLPSDSHRSATGQGHTALGCRSVGCLGQPCDTCLTPQLRREGPGWVGTFSAWWSWRLRGVGESSPGLLRPSLRTYSLRLVPYSQVVKSDIHRGRGRILYSPWE